MAAITYLGPEDHKRVSAAVSMAERHTAGEIVTILADRSDGYGDVQLTWSSLAALLKLLGFAFLPAVPIAFASGILGHWNVEWTPRASFILASLAASMAFAFTWLIQQWDAVRFVLIPGVIKSVRVHERAVQAFKVGAERRTHGRTGILIYLSLRERRAEIVADEAIASKVDPEVWGEAMDAMLSELKNGRVADGMIAAIERVGKVLADHFPVHEDDRNELPDRLIEL